MKADYINPFISSTLNVLQTMCQTSPKPGSPTLKEGISTWGEVTGIIGIAGDKLTGNLMLSFDAPSICEIVSKMLMEDFAEVNDEVVDAVGELTNMVMGGAKRIFNEDGHVFDMATPIMLVGKDIDIKQLGKDPVILVPFDTEKGRFVIEATLTERPQE